MYCLPRHNASLESIHCPVYPIEGGRGLDGKGKYWLIDGTVGRLIGLRPNSARVDIEYGAEYSCGGVVTLSIVLAKGIMGCISVGDVPATADARSGTPPRFFPRGPFFRDFGSLTSCALCVRSTTSVGAALSLFSFLVCCRENLYAGWSRRCCLATRAAILLIACIRIHVLPLLTCERQSVCQHGEERPVLILTDNLLQAFRTRYRPAHVLIFHEMVTKKYP